MTDSLAAKYIERIDGERGNNLERVAQERDRRRKPIAVAIERAADKPRRLTFTRIDKIMSRPTDWLLRDYLVCDTLAGLIGAPGSYKTFLAFEWAACIATGTPWCDREVRKGAVFVLSGEGQRGTRKRFDGWSKARGVSLDGCPLYVASNLPLLCDPEHVAETIAVMRETVAAMAEGGDAPKLIVIDTVARAMNGANENDTADMGKFVAAMDALKNEWGACVLAVHHTGLANDSRARGSGALAGAMDSDFFLTKQAEAVQLTAGEKHKDWREPPPVLLSPTEIDVEVVGDEGPEIETTLVLHDMPGSISAALKREKAVDLHNAGKTYKEIAEAIGEPKTTVYRWLKLDPKNDDEITPLLTMPFRAAVPLLGL